MAYPVILRAHLSLRTVTRLIAVRAPEPRLTPGVVAIPGHHPTRTATPTARPGAVSDTRQVVSPPPYREIKKSLKVVFC